MKRYIRKGLAVLGMVAMLMTMLPTGILLASAENTADFDLPEGYTLSAIETVDDLRAPLVTNNPYFYIALTCMIIGSQLFLAGFLAELVSRSASDRNVYRIEKKI